MKESPINAYILGLIVVSVAILLEYIRRRKTKYKDDDFLGKRLTWETYVVALLGIYVIVLLILNLFD